MSRTESSRPKSRPVLACVASANVHLVYDDGTSEKVESKYASEVRSRAAQIDRKGAWKKGGSGAAFMGGGAGMLWAEDRDDMPIVATSVARGRTSKEILYTLRTPAVGGLFALDLGTHEEARVFHGTGHDFQGLSSSEYHTVLATTSQGKLRRGIAVMKDDGTELATITEGDSFDDDPSWVPVPPVDGKCIHELVYSSAGIGRDEAGQFAGLGPRSVVLLDAEHGTTKTLVEDSKHDYVCPRMAKDGTLFCVRRPYVSPFEKAPASASIKDAALLPFRLGTAVFNYLDFFSMRYTGKPLASSGSTKDRAADARRMLELGNLGRGVAQLEHGLTNDTPSDVRVPTSWALVKIAPRGSAHTAQVVAERVAAFDLSPSGTVVYTDGAALHRLDGTKTTKLVDLPYVTDLAAL